VHSTAAITGGVVHSTAAITGGVVHSTAAVTGGVVLCSCSIPSYHIGFTTMFHLCIPHCAVVSQIYHPIHNHSHHHQLPSLPHPFDSH
jgi:hypothetical protein